MDQQQTEPIISHMNEDHADAVLAYVLAFADFEKAQLPAGEDIESAALTGIDTTGMDILCSTSNGAFPVRINYRDSGVGERLESASCARTLLVDMVKAARKILDN